MNFVAIDLETANADMASICQIGLVKCENGTLSDEWKTYVDPEDYFDGINVSIHGIDESVVKGAPKFPELADSRNAKSAIRKRNPKEDGDEYTGVRIGKRI
ncbi:MAG: hypothetical protein KGZ32_00550 [Dethiobacter sp.]|jgi:DNA polymerase-3 subunit epsilon|nr:hypothetical protein [Dethiobacter sp.]